MADSLNRFLRVLRIVIVLGVVLTAAYLVWRFLIRQPPIHPSVIQLSGRIESDDATIASKVPGRIREITVREGDPVKAGQVVAILEDDQIRAREDQARSAVDQAEARVQRSEQQVAVLNAQLEQSRLGINQAKQEAEGRVSQAEAQIATAEAMLAQAEAAYGQARYDEEKFSRLAGQGDVSERQGRQARTNSEAQAAAVRAARKQVEVARGALTAAKANLANAAIRSSAAKGVEEQIKQTQSEIDGSKADAERVRAQLREAQANRNDLQILAPFDAVVATRSAEPGEVISAGTPILTLVNFNQVYLRGFVPGGQIDRVKVGLKARVFLDGAPNISFEAVVSRVDPEASFTPENTYFRDDRVKQVFGVKLLITNPERKAKPGMPADGEILVLGDTWPTDNGRQ